MKTQVRKRHTCGFLEGAFFCCLVKSKVFPIEMACFLANRHFAAILPVSLGDLRSGML